MTTLVPITLIGWIPIVLLMFAILPPRRAVIVSFIAAWLFLPVSHQDILEHTFNISGLPPYNKTTATSFGVLIGTAIFQASRLTALRLRWFDLPIIIWCLCPIVSSLANADGLPTNALYDGLSEAMRQTVTWGLPYLIGRAYFHNLASLRELAIGIFIGGLIYIPLCLFELKMSPQLHFLFYGAHPHPDFKQTIRYGGYRPTVFMSHGLMVASWMAAATLVGSWTWFTGSIKRIAGIPVTLLLPVLFLITILCKSLAPLLLMCMGLGAVFTASRQRAVWPIVLMIAIAPVYIALRTTGVWDGMNLVALAESAAGVDRAQSLQTRFENEDMLTERALQRPLFGWAGWGRSRIYDQWGKDISITDGQWIIALGKHGLVGLISLTTAILLPAWLTLKRYPVRYWAHPRAAPAAAMAVLLVLFMVDNLLNAMMNPVYMLVAGALASQTPLATRTKRKKRSPNQAPNPHARHTSQKHTRAAAVQAD